MQEKNDRRAMTTFIKKSVCFVLGFMIFIFCRKKINLGSVVNGKRVVIIGAANSLQGTNSGSLIDSFDIVVRVNKATLLLKDGKWKNDIGTRVDVLFHSFYENEKSGGGPLDLPLFDRLGVRYIINPIADWGGHRVTFNFYKKYLIFRRVYSLQRPSYNRIKSQLGGFQPTIGFCAIHSILEKHFSELYITGFTFFRTPFADGYRNEIKESEKANDYIKSAGLHNPDFEFEAFLKLLKQNKHKKVVLDKALQAIVDVSR